MVSDLKKLIESASSPQEAAQMIIHYLDGEGLALFGNGWLDDDPDWNSLTEEDNENLYNKQKEILQVEPL
jgi:hypothetical protein